MKKKSIFLLILVPIVLCSEIIIDEDFSGLWPPAGWTTTGGTNWQQGTGNNAGGTAPEARFYWSPSATAVFRLISPQYDTTGGTTLQLSFKHYIDHFSGAYNLKIQTTSDGVNWNDVWSLSPTGNVGPETLSLDVSTPDVGSQNFQIAWVFDGYTWNINNWYVDDIFLEGQLIVYDNDLAGMTITGSTVVNAGNTENYTVTVKNVGNNPQTGYTVKLFKNNNIELASLNVNSTIQPEEQAVHNLVWQIPAGEPQGTVTLNGRVILAGDENPNNDNTNLLPVLVFPPGILEISIGSGTELNNRTPIRFQYKNSLTECLFFPSELQNITGTITSVKYSSSFTNNLYKPVGIWAGHTTQSSLIDGWIPASQLTQVFDGFVNFPAGQHTIEIEFDTPFFYEGDNLVIMVHRPMDITAYGSTDNFLHTTTSAFPSRTRYQADDTLICDPHNPPDVSYTFDKFANITLVFFQGTTGNVEGFVRDDNNAPLSGADVLIEELNMISYTDDQGYYYFGNVLTGTYDFTANKFGYSPQTVQAEVLQDETITVDFALSPLGIVEVSGHVEGSDFPGIGLEGALVHLTGFENYLVYTDDGGDFSIPGVYTNITYDLEISYEGYTALSEEVQVGSENLDLGTLVLAELAFPPGNVVAVQNDDQTEVDLTWNSPGQGGGEFRYDDGVADFQIGFTNTPPNGVFGAVHPNISIIQEVQWYLSSIYGTHNNVKILILGLDNNDEPDVNQIYHQSALLPNVDDEWNSYILDEQITALEGFFVGVITPNQYTSLALDDGVGEPWVFQFGTHFSNENWLAGNNWQDIGNIGTMFQRNMLLRAYGVNMGNTDEQSARRTELPSGRQREFESYNVYRFPVSQQGNPALWNLIAEAVTDTFYTDTSWHALSVNTYKFAITSVHTNSIESIPAFSAQIQKTIPGVGNDPDLSLIAPQLYANFPNPFYPSAAARSSATTISFSITSISAEDVKLEIYNLKGQKVKELVNDKLASGRYALSWDGNDDNGKTVSSGVYLYRLETGSFRQTRKMVLIK